MSSPRLDTEVEPYADAGVLFRLLDPAFGFFVWAAHFLAVYITTALACVLGLGTANPGSRMMFLTVLVIVTAVAALILVGHAVWRYGQQRGETRLRFRMTLTIGCDAIAALAVLGQLIPILLVPVCA
jgi:FlaA1/EpsC-like NDP-sugar epimerase